MCDTVRLVRKRGQINRSFWMDAELSAEVDTLAKKLGITRSEVIRLAVTQFVLNEANDTPDGKETK